MSVFVCVCSPYLTPLRRVSLVEVISHTSAVSTGGPTPRNLLPRQGEIARGKRQGRTEGKEGLSITRRARAGPRINWKAAKEGPKGGSEDKENAKRIRLTAQRKGNEEEGGMGRGLLANMGEGEREKRRG